MLETIIYCLILIACLLLMFFKPISKYTLSSRYIDYGIGTVVLIILFIVVIATYVSPAMIEEDLAKEPCGSATPQGVCYSIDHGLCQSLWQKARGDCQIEMSDIIKSRPTGLIGPGLNRCSARKMDKAIRYNRAKTESAYCKAYFKYIEEVNGH